MDEARHQTLKLEVWDHKLHLNHFRGGCSLDLKQIIQARRTNKTVKLSGVRRGELSFEVCILHSLLNFHNNTSLYCYLCDCA